MNLSPIRDASFYKLVIKYIWSAEDFIKNNKFYSGINHTAFLIPQILSQIPLFCLSSKYKTPHHESPSPSSILCHHPSFWTEITKVNKVNQASLTLAWFFLHKCSKYGNWPHRIFKFALLILCIRNHRWEFSKPLLAKTPTHDLTIWLLLRNL